GVSAEAVDGVADLELGGAEEVSVVLAGEQPGELAGLVEEGRLDRLEEALGQGFLFGGKRDVRHGTSVCKRGGRISRADNQTPLESDISRPLSRRLPKYRP